jgi:hypothetical protein
VLALEKHHFPVLKISAGAQTLNYRSSSIAGFLAASLFIGYMEFQRVLLDLFTLPKVHTFKIQKTAP